VLDLIYEQAPEAMHLQQGAQGTVHAYAIAERDQQVMSNKPRLAERIAKRDAEFKAIQDDYEKWVVSVAKRFVEAAKRMQASDLTVHCDCGSSYSTKAATFSAWSAEHEPHMSERVDVTETWHQP